MIFRILFLIIFLFVFTGCKPSTPKKHKRVGTLNKNQVIAVVNGEKVLAGPIEEILSNRMLAYQRQTGKPFPANKIEQARRQLIEQLINETVVMQAVNKSDIKVDEKEVNARLEQIKKMLGGEEEFKKYLKQSKYSLEQFKKDIASDIKATILMEQQMGSPTVTVAEAKEFYDENKADFVLPENVNVSHILIKVSPDTLMATQKMIKAELRKIKKDILDGKITFEEAAEKYSECPTAKYGGKVGLIYKNDQSISLPFADAAFSLPVSNISDVVETEFGDHLIFVTEKNATKTASFDEVKYKLIDYLTNKKKQDLAEEWTIELRTKADVKYK